MYMTVDCHVHEFEIMRSQRANFLRTLVDLPSKKILQINRRQKYQQSGVHFIYNYSIIKINGTNHLKNRPLSAYGQTSGQLLLFPQGEDHGMSDLFSEIILLTR